MSTFEVLTNIMDALLIKADMASTPVDERFPNHKAFHVGRADAFLESVRIVKAEREKVRSV